MSNSDKFRVMFEQKVWDSKGGIIDDCLVSFARENGIIDINSAVKYFGLEQLISSEEDVDIMTDLGQATAMLTEDNSVLRIKLNDSDTNATIGSIQIETTDWDSHKMLYITLFKS